MVGLDQLITVQGAVCPQVLSHQGQGVQTSVAIAQLCIFSDRFRISAWIQSTISSRAACISGSKPGIAPYLSNNSVHCTS